MDSETTHAARYRPTRIITNNTQKTKEMAQKLRFKRKQQIPPKNPKLIPAHDSPIPKHIMAPTHKPRHHTATTYKHNHKYPQTTIKDQDRKRTCNRPIKRLSIITTSNHRQTHLHINLAKQDHHGTHAGRTSITRTS